MIDETAVVAIAGLAVTWTVSALAAGYRMGIRVGHADESNGRRHDRHRDYLQPAPNASPFTRNTRTFATNAPMVRVDTNPGGVVTHVDGLPKSYLFDFAYCLNREDWKHSNQSYSECRKWCMRHHLIEGAGWRADLDTATRRRRAVFAVVDGQSVG